MEKIEPGKYVEMVYDLYSVNPDGTETLVHQSDPEDPEKFVFGVTRGMIAPLEKALEGLEKDAPFDVAVKADEAFGPYDPEQVAVLDRDIFLVDGKFDEEMIKVGAIVPMMTADGYRINGVVKEITPEKVSMDFNHPLAGKDVRFKGQVKEVHDATPEELKPFQGGCGCGDGGCGDGCGDGCGGGCEGGCCH
ncbi:MAG: peptidylprolyl isomerase [Muribaculaceae bacterium]|nr:peptidylprolyl isomerase [Muribaculaceae bacterium]